ncbi:MAG TPA: DUF2807 domain-containing protein [Bacteroidia bacterium]|nr:DUF2807 domain-containing protein [Bacteroidia bacterium]HNU34335.1 DUF2807 domain-containing protein [Bacteroidia bacterium]
MKALKLFLAAYSLATGCVFAQQTTALPDFDRISIRSVVNGTITQGTSNSIMYDGENMTLKFEVSNGTLIVSGVSTGSVDITFKELAELEISGSAKLSSTNMIQTKDFEINVSGSAKLNLQLQANDVEAKISGVGSLDMTGTANSFDVKISGSGKIYADNFTVKNSSYNISGNATAYVNVTDTLTGNVSGLGKIYFRNQPIKIYNNISGIGKIEQQDGNTSTDTDTTHIRFGNNSITIVTNGDSTKTNIQHQYRKATGHWSGLDLGFNGFLDKGNSNDLPKDYEFLELVPEKSIAVNLNFYDYDFKIYKRYVIATTGIGLSYNNFRFRKSFTLVPDTNIVTYEPDSIKFKKHKLTVSYLTVPLLVTFNTHESYRKAFHITTGLLLSYKLGSHTKQVYNVDGEKKKDKDFDDFNIDPFRYDATVRIGYRNYTAFINYAISDFFKNNSGPELHPWAFGVSLTAW